MSRVVVCHPDNEQYGRVVAHVLRDVLVDEDVDFLTNRYAPTDKVFVVDPDFKIDVKLSWSWES